MSERGLLPPTGVSGWDAGKRSETPTVKSSMHYCSFSECRKYAVPPQWGQENEGGRDVERAFLPAARIWSWRCCVEWTETLWLAVGLRGSGPSPTGVLSTVPLACLQIPTVTCKECDLSLLHSLISWLHKSCCSQSSDTLATYTKANCV